MCPASTTPQAKTSKGARRRQDIIQAAAEILNELGPQAVTHRAVAARAECSLSATTYYFDGLEELLTEAATLNIRSWANRAERAASDAMSHPLPDGLPERTELLLRACLPAEGSLAAHYLQLVGASQSPLVTRAYQRGRYLLDAELARLLNAMEIPMRPSHLMAIVDGAAVSALSEGLDIRETAQRIVLEVLTDMSTGGTPADSGEAPEAS